MIPDPEPLVAQQGSPWPRRIALAIGWFKTAASGAALLALLFAMPGQDPAGQGMAGGMAAMVVVYWLVFILPGLWLATKGRRIGLSLALLILPDLAMGLFALTT